MSDQLLQQIDELLEKRFQVFTDKFDRKLDDQTDEIKRHTGVLLEGCSIIWNCLPKGSNC